MKYSKVYMDSMGYELAPVVISSLDIEEMLAPLYKKLHLSEGQLEALTGIYERRWWEKGFLLSDGAIAAARKALKACNVAAHDIEVLIYGGVCRENFEPATACRVAHALGVHPDALVYDITNACLGVMNGIVDIANHIELGHIKAGMVVSCESSRDIIELAVKRMLKHLSWDYFIDSIATLTGGSGAIAVVLTDGSFSPDKRRKLLGGAGANAPEFHGLCRWGMELQPDGDYVQIMVTDSVGILRNGVNLGKRTWETFKNTLGWLKTTVVDKIVCHQVGETHRKAILETLEIEDGKDFATYPYLGNIGTVSLPISAAIADERGFFKPGDRVGFLGIGSGLNCLMLGWEW